MGFFKKMTRYALDPAGITGGPDAVKNRLAIKTDPLDAFGYRKGLEDEQFRSDEERALAEREALYSDNTNAINALFGNTTDLSGAQLAEAQANATAREAQLTGVGGQREGIMAYFNNEIERQRQLAEKNIRLTMARRGRRGSALSGAMMDLNDANTREQGKFSGEADRLIRGIRTADDTERQRLVDALTGNAGESADIAGTTSALQSNLDLASEQADQMNMANLFSGINSIYGQQGAQRAYDSGRRSVRPSGYSATSNSDAPITSSYG